MRVTIRVVMAVLLMVGFAGCRSKGELELLRPGDRQVWERVDRGELERQSEQLPKVEVRTNRGTFVVELFTEQAPISVENFLTYVADGFYAGTLFHRIERGLVIQGGGYESGMNLKETREPIINEAGNGLRNVRGTLGMARTAQMDSANAQFFINLADNPFFNGDGVTGGYAVFGRVYDGMDVVDTMALSEVKSVGPMNNVPVEPIIIESMRLLE